MSSVLVPHAATSVSIVRHRCVDELRARGVAPVTIDDTALILSELVGNAVRHGRPLDGGGVEARWQVTDSMVRVEVRDGGRGPLLEVGSRPGVRRGTADDEGGRGLAIVALLSASWGSAFDADEVVVWADVPMAVESSDGTSARTEERQEA